MANYRLASQVKIGFPYKHDDVCWIEMDDCVPSHLRSDTEKREGYRRALARGAQLYAVWPGTWSSDLFLLDDMDAVAKALDMTADAP